MNTFRPAVLLVPAALAGLLALAAGCDDNLTHPESLAPFEPSAPAPLACSPDLDGQIVAEELQPALGVPVSYVVSSGEKARPVDVAGEVDGEGRRTWDWSTVVDDDRRLTLSAQPIDGRWYADRFPEDAFVVQADLDGLTEGIYTQDAEALWLHGLASPQPSPPEGVTLLPYGAPVPVFRFPIAPGQAWVASATVQNGTVRGLPYAGKDIYEVEVDGAGRLELPDLTLTQALRVRTRVTVQPAVGASTSRRQVSFLFECLGEVARAVSLPDEPEEDFTTAAEVRRLGL